MLDYDRQLIPHCKEIEYEKRKNIVDLINTILYGYPDIELISLSLPGVVYNGVVTLKKYGLNECHLQAFLEEKYLITFSEV